MKSGEIVPPPGNMVFRLPTVLYHELFLDTIYEKQSDEFRNFMHLFLVLVWAYLSHIRGVF